MINALAAGESFGLICEGLCEWIDEQNVDACGNFVKAFYSG